MSDVIRGCGLVIDAAHARAVLRAGLRQKNEPQLRTRSDRLDAGRRSWLGVGRAWEFRDRGGPRPQTGGSTGLRRATGATVRPHPRPHVVGRGAPSHLRVHRLIAELPPFQGWPPSPGGGGRANGAVVAPIGTRNRPEPIYRC